VNVGTRKEKSAEKKRLLLDAAERVYYRDGDLGLTVRRLASEASTTSQTIYTYFGSRDAVVVGMYDRVLADVDGLLSTIEAASRRTPSSIASSPRSAVLPLAQIYRRHVLTKPAQFRMMATARGPEGTDSARIVERRDRLVNIIEQAGAPGGGAMIVAAVNGFVEAELSRMLATNGRSEVLFAELIAGLTAKP
jgi:AcrR family transcriptional regulator